LSGQVNPISVFKPGGGLVKAAKAIADPERMLGEYAYQWLYPGPNSRPVFANGVIPLPDASGGPVTAAVVSYQVPSGWRFSLRGIVLAFIGSGWAEGSGDLVFQVEVQAAGIRNLEFLGQVLTHIGSLDDGPYPILGRMEFAPLDTLVVNVTNNAVALVGTPFVTAHLVGHIYPNSQTKA
jgi:hypothetical protein